MNQLERFFITLETLKEIASCTGSAINAAFTIGDVEDFVDSRMAELGVTGKCPVCRNSVVANPYSPRGVIGAHIDKAGGDCVKGRGLPLHLAAV